MGLLARRLGDVFEADEGPVAGERLAQVLGIQQRLDGVVALVAEQVVLSGDGRDEVPVASVLRVQALAEHALAVLVGSLVQVGHGESLAELGYPLEQLQGHLVPMGKRLALLRLVGKLAAVLPPDEVQRDARNRQQHQAKRDGSGVTDAQDALVNL